MNECELINNTQRIVLFQGNSRHTYIVNPNSSVIADEVDIRGLGMVKKLVSRGVLRVRDVDKKPKAAVGNKRSAGTTVTKAKVQSKKKVSVQKKSVKT